MSHIYILPKLSSCDQLFANVGAKAIEHGFIAREVKGKSLRWLIIEGNDYIFPATGPIKPVRILIDHEGRYKFQVFNITLKEGHVNDGTIDDYIYQMKATGRYLLCPGVYASYQELKDSLKRKPNKLREWPGMTRFDHVDCQLWYDKDKMPKKQSKATCVSCTSLINSMRNSKKKNKSTLKQALSTPHKATPLRFLTPNTRRKTLRKRASNKWKLTKKLEKYNVYRCKLNEEQSDEMKEILKILSTDFQGDVESLFSQEKGDVVRKIWENDVNENKQAFMKDQNTNSQNKGNRFSTISYRVALAVFSRSPAAYEALKSFNILTLPSVSTLKSFMRASAEDPGLFYDRMADESKNYSNLQDIRRKTGSPVPEKEGTLIFDEVKVTANIYWNAKANKFIGHALSHDDMSSMHDVYIELDDKSKASKASYILQFLWRDISSDVDIVGPYYTSEKGLEHKFIMACVLETIHLFSLFGFNIMLLICDGASSNLKLLKLLCGEKAAVYGIKDNENRYDVKTSFLNIYTNTQIHVMICPSHQLKNMVAALYSSRQQGTKYFLYEGIHFGWNAITDMYNREIIRAENNQIRRVPNLLSNYVYRDQWVRLNVKASKIMQQDHVIAELREQFNSTNDESLSITLQYLEACNNLFEQGLLSHNKVKYDDLAVLEKMEEGMNFFMGWCDNSILNNIHITNNTQKAFLSWQTWDLMRVTFFGFKSFVESFTQRHHNDGLYIIPVRLNGSAVETLFSQLKYSAGGHLSSTNYATARSSLLIKKQVRGHNVKDKEYRNVTLNMLNQPLRRK